MSAPNVITPAAGGQVVRPMAPTRIGFNGSTFHRDFRYGLNGHGWGPDITLTRATVALYEDASGIWQKAASGAGRINTSLGILVEEQRINLCAVYNAPEAVDPVTGYTGTGVTVTNADDATALAVVVDPTICTRAIQMAGGAGGTVTVAGAAGAGAHSLQCIARVTAGSGATMQLGGLAGTVSLSGSTYARYKLENKTAVGGELVTFNVPAGCTIMVVLVGLEAGAVATSPIIVTGSSATRNGDLMTIPYTGIMNDEFTVVCGFRTTVSGFSTFSYLFEATLLDGYRRMLAFPASNVVRGGIQNGAWQAQVDSTTAVVDGADHIVAFAARKNNFELVLDGALEGSDYSGTIPTTNTPTKINIGSYWQNAKQANCWIKPITIYPYALPQARMLALTSG